MQKAEGNQDQTAEAARTAVMAALPPAPPPAQMQHRSTSAVHVAPSSATRGGAVLDNAHVHSHGVAVGGGAASVFLSSQQQQAVAPSSSSSFSLGTTSSAAGGAPLHASVLCSTVNPPAAAAAATVRCDQRRVLAPRWRRTLRRLWHRCRALVTFVFFWALARVGIIERKGGAAPNSSRAATRAAVVGGGHALRPDTTARVQTLLVFAFHAAVLLWLSLESPTAAYAPTEATPSVFSSLLPAGLFSFFSSSWPSPHTSSNGPLRFVNEGGHDGEGTNGGVSEGEDEYSSFFDGDYAEDGEWFVFSYSGDDGEGYGAAAAAVSGGSGAAVGARQSVADAAAERLRSPRTLRVDV